MAFKFRELEPRKTVFRVGDRVYKQQRYLDGSHTSMGRVLALKCRAYSVHIRVEWDGIDHPVWYTNTAGLRRSTSSLIAARSRSRRKVS